MEDNAQPLPRLRDAHVVTWMRIARIYDKINRISAEHLRRWDLSAAQFDVLAQVGSAQGQTQQELADRLLVTKGNISQLLAKIETRGLIRRVEHGRCMRVYLTSEGRQLYEDVVPAQERLIAQYIQRLPAEDEHALRRALARLDHLLTS